MANCHFADLLRIHANELHIFRQMECNYLVSGSRILGKWSIKVTGDLEIAFSPRVHSGVHVSIHLSLYSRQLTPVVETD